MLQWNSTDTRACKQGSISKCRSGVLCTRYHAGPKSYIVHYRIMTKL